jgi:hypothetical protein
MNKNEFNGILSEKIGYDNENKKFLIRVYPSLFNVVEHSPLGSTKSWANVVRLMFLSEGKNLNEVTYCIPSYYSSVKRCLKEIDVIRYEGRELVKGSNWNRFFGDEDWSWFIMRTGSCEYSTIIK